MRKVSAFLMALSFVIAVSGLAFAGGADGMCSYSHTKKNTAEKAEPVKTPVAKKSDSKTVTDQLLLAQKAQTNKKTETQKK